MEDHGSADIHTAAHGRPHAAAGGGVLKEAAAHGAFTLEQTPSRNCGPGREAYTEARFLAGTVTLQGTYAEAVHS